MENRSRVLTTLEFRVATSVAPSAQAEKAVEVLQANGATEACVVGRAKVLTQKRVVDGWTFVPWDQDVSAMPSRTWQLVMALHEAGIYPISYAIGHEPKKTAQDVIQDSKAQVVAGLAKAKTQWAKFQTAAIPVIQQAAETAKQWGEAAAPVARQAVESGKRFVVAAAPVVWDVTKVTVKLAAVTAVAVGTVAVCALGLALSSLALIDPVLYAILPADDGGDPVWILASRWYD